LETKKKFENSTTLGVGDWEEAHGVKFVDIDGIKLGFIAGTSCDFSALKDKWTDSNKIGCAWINSVEVNKQIRKNKDKCDYLFVISHGGLEYMNIPLPEWRDRYRELIDLGVDAVIGGHPHVPQGVEIYKEKPIFYSLGNFYFDNLKINKPDLWDNGIFAIIEIENNIITQKIIPTIRKGHRVDIDDSKEIEQHLLDISSVLANEDSYMEQVNSEVLRLYPKYEGWLLDGFNALEIKFNLRSLGRILKRGLIMKSNPNYKIAMHQLREDSTRWALSRALKLMSKSDL
jgi:poly-gamma-glutamate synthesis protein (capsule biosynthesis protein)